MATQASARSPETDCAARGLCSTRCCKSVAETLHGCDQGARSWRIQVYDRRASVFSHRGGTILRFNRAAAFGLLLPALAFGAAACGDDDESSSGSGSTAEGTTLTIYSSLPLQGTSRGQSEAVINGEKLALEEVNSKVGKYSI